MPDNDGFPYEGPPGLREPITGALASVIDPEVGIGIVDLGLVYGVRVEDLLVDLRLTMTSAACPLADAIIGDIESALDAVLPPEFMLRVQLVYEPPWSPANMGSAARAAMGW